MTFIEGIIKEVKALKDKLLKIIIDPYRNLIYL
jgi:hypothetical protein